MNYVILFIGIIIGAGIVSFFCKRKCNYLGTESPSGKEGVGGGGGINEINKKRIEAKELAKEKILLTLRSSNGELLDEKKKVVNNDVEKLLGVSDATATNYLSELEAEGKIIQKGGEEGRGVYYEISS